MTVDTFLYYSIMTLYALAVVVALMPMISKRKLKTYPVMVIGLCCLLATKEWALDMKTKIITDYQRLCSEYRTTLQDCMNRRKSSNPQPYRSPLWQYKRIENDEFYHRAFYETKD